MTTPPPHKDPQNVSIWKGELPLIGELVAKLHLGTMVLSIEPKKLHFSTEGVLKVNGNALFKALIGSAQVSEVSLDLQSAEISLGSSPKLGSFEESLLQKLILMLSERAGVGPGGPSGSDWVDDYWRLLPESRRGWRRLWARPLIASWGVEVLLSPEVRVTLKLGPQKLSISLDPGIEISVPGLICCVKGVRYDFGSGELRFEDDAREFSEGHHRLMEILLRIGAWGAQRKLRGWLPTPMVTTGYNLFKDQQRAQHLRTLWSRLRPPKKIQRSSSPSPSKSPKSVPPELSLSSKHIARFSLGRMGTGALAFAGADLTLTRSRDRLTLNAAEGLWIDLSAGKAFGELRVQEIEFSLDGPHATLSTSPPAGPLLTRLFDGAHEQWIRPMITQAVQRGWGLGGASEGSEETTLIHLFAGGPAELSLRMDAEESCTLRRNEHSLSLEAPSGLRFSMPALSYIPDLSIRSLVLDLKSMSLSGDTTPTLDPFGAAALTHLLRKHGLSHAPDALGLQLPEPSAPLKALRESHPLVFLDLPALPVLGRFEVRASSTDQQEIHLSESRWEIRSKEGIALLAEDIDLSLTLSRLTFDLKTGQLDVDASLKVEGYGEEFLIAMLRWVAETLLPESLLSKLPHPSNTGDWVLGSFSKEQFSASVSLQKGATLSLKRTPTGLSLSSTEGIVLNVAAGSKALKIKTHRLGWFLPSGAIAMEVTPRLGPLGKHLLENALSGLIPREKLNVVLQKLHLPLLAPPTTKAPDSKGEVVVWEKEFPVIGVVSVAFDVSSKSKSRSRLNPREGGFGSLDRSRAIRARLDTKTLSVDAGSGRLKLHCPTLSLHLSLERARILWKDWRLETLQTSPSVGALERKLLSVVIESMQSARARSVLPPHKTSPQEHGTLLVLGEGQPWGLICISAAENGLIELGIDHQVLQLTSAGIHFDGKPLDWLPKFSLQGIEYALGVGSISLDIGELAEQFYQEEHDVSPTSEVLMEYFIKGWLAPRAPNILRQLGLVTFDEDEGDLELEEDTLNDCIPLAEIPLPAHLGDALLALDPDDQVSVVINATEIILISEEGIIISLPELRYLRRLRKVRYHLQSGEVEVEGFGGFENAIVAALLARQFRQKNATLFTPSVTPLRAKLDALPRDERGRREVVDLGSASLYLTAEPVCVELQMDLSGLTLSISPALMIDGPGVVDYQLEGMRFSFEEGCFSLLLEEDGLIAGFFTKMVRKKAEDAITQRFLDLLPSAMRIPGYRLDEDPNSAQNIAELISNMSLKKA